MTLRTMREAVVADVLEKNRYRLARIEVGRPLFDNVARDIVDALNQTDKLIAHVEVES